MSRLIQFGDLTEKALLGDTVRLQDGENRKVVACQKTGVPMLNIDAEQIKLGDLRFIKKLGLTISNPETDQPVALGVDFEKETFGHKLASYFHDDVESPESDESDSDDEDDDSGFFSAIAGAAIGSSFGGSSSSGGFGGGFGGFGGGGFSGGGASGGF